MSQYTEEVESAIAILGKSKVVTANKVTQKWGGRIPKSLSIPFSEDVLRQCAHENTNGQADWRLIYTLGLSMRDLWRRRGIDLNKQPCFGAITWWLPKSDCSYGTEPELPWVTKEKEADYKLLNFKLQFTNMNWDEQTKAIADLGEKYDRALERDVAETFFTCFMAKGEDLFGLKAHWGPSLSPHGYRVYLGGQGFVRSHPGCLTINGCSDDSHSGDIGVIIIRKP